MLHGEEEVKRELRKKRIEAKETFVLRLIGLVVRGLYGKHMYIRRSSCVYKEKLAKWRMHRKQIKDSIYE